MMAENGRQGVSSYELRLQQELDLIGRLRQEIEGLFHVADVRASERGDAVMFVGQLASTGEVDAIYGQLRERFKRLGYTPVLRREGARDIVVAQRGLIGTARFNPLINVLLFVATLFTTLLAGASFANPGAMLPALRALLNGNLERLVPVLLSGLPFAGTLLFILGVHEMGHYVAARLHGVQVTLPYFIPVPFGLGTFGAFIQMKSPVENRKALFDVGLAGPLAGLAVALPLMAVGLLTSEVVGRTVPQGMGTSLLLRWMVDVLVPHAANEAVRLSPMAIAAWFGLLVTGFNLLPMGQLDGGHVAYAVLGKWAQPLALATFAAMLVMGYTLWSGWYTWAFFAFITGLRHAEPLNDITPLDWGRRVIALATVVLFFLLITPRPF
jgi:membrane-associated protease RseP (regulator of RpoE activity)